MCEIADCTFCPCLNSRLDRVSCNLGYEVLGLNLDCKDIFGSVNCDLLSIEYGTEVMYPTRITVEENHV